jgi:polyisoprenoid-binding protein YceI
VKFIKFYTVVFVQLSTLFIATALASAEPVSYNFDKLHTEILAKWDHGGVSQLTAKFPKFSGELLFDEKDVTKTTVNISIDVRSVTTGFQALDSNIASENFFDPVTYPTIEFASTAVKRTGTKTAMLTGDMTLHGVTRSVSLDVKLVHQGEHALKWFHAA